MNETMQAPAHVLCLDNDGFPTSLEVRKVYRCVVDEEARQHGMLRVIDETGEDYLYPADMFQPVELPPTAAMLFDTSR
jgi:hypothetical protein